MNAFVRIARIVLLVLVVFCMGVGGHSAAASDQSTKVDSATFKALKATIVNYADGVTNHDGEAVISLMTDTLVQEVFGSPDRAAATQAVQNWSAMTIMTAYNGREYSDGHFTIDFTAAGLRSPYHLETNRWVLIPDGNGGYLIDSGGKALKLKVPKGVNTAIVDATIAPGTVTLSVTSVDLSSEDVLQINLSENASDQAIGLAVFRGEEFIDRLGLNPGELWTMGITGLTPGEYQIVPATWTDTDVVLSWDAASTLTVKAVGK